MSDDGLVETDVRRSERGAVATLTLANPAKANCLGRATMEAFIARAEALCREPGLRAVVVTGAGERAFCGGADIREMAALSDVTARPFITLLHHVCAAVRELPVPVIARLNGATLGGGLELAAACDFRIAAANATFGMPEVRLGMPSVIEAALLPQLIGWGRTRRLLFTGATIDAQTALAWGLVEEVVPGPELDIAVARALDGILASGPVAVHLQKRLIQDWERLPMAAAIDAGIDCYSEAWASDEPRRLTAAYLNRRR